MNVYEIVTEKVIESLNAGKIPWEKPWVGGRGQAKNLVTKKPYRGINVWLTAMRGFNSPYWLTFNQVRALKGTVNKGEKSTLVVFWKKMEKSESAKDKALAAKDRDYFWMLRYYNVFNVEQTSGLEKRIPVEAAKEAFEPIEAADAILKTASANGLPSVVNGGDSAYYNTIADLIRVPAKSSFKTSEGYYGTVFHELTHATGHSTRLNRDLKNVFGSHEYSKEELVAEMGSAFLMGMIGLTKTFPNTVAYVQSWISALKNDPKMIVLAASQAQRAVEYIQHGKETPEVTEEES